MSHGFESCKVDDETLYIESKNISKERSQEEVVLRGSQVKTSTTSLLQQQDYNLKPLDSIDRNL